MFHTTYKKKLSADLPLSVKQNNTEKKNGLKIDNTRHIFTKRQKLG